MARTAPDPVRTLVSVPHRGLRRERRPRFDPFSAARGRAEGVARGRPVCSAADSAHRRVGLCGRGGRVNEPAGGLAGRATGCPLVGRADPCLGASSVDLCLVRRGAGREGR